MPAPGQVSVHADRGPVLERAGARRASGQPAGRADRCAGGAEQDGQHEEPQCVGRASPFDLSRVARGARRELDLSRVLRRLGGRSGLGRQLPGQLPGGHMTLPESLQGGSLARREPVQQFTAHRSLATQVPGSHAPEVG